MIALALAGALVSSPATCAIAPGNETQQLARADSLDRLFASGRPFAEFLRTATARRETWTGNYAAVALDQTLVARARAVPGHWRLVAVLEDSCGDSANTIPWLAQLVDSVPGLALRVVSSREGRFVMERHRTSDGRAATPTVVLLDEQGNERGCFIERPLALQSWVAQHKPRLGGGDFLDAKYAWYRADAGRETVREFVELMESAALGTPRCQSVPPP